MARFARLGDRVSIFVSASTESLNGALAELDLDASVELLETFKIPGGGALWLDSSSGGGGFGLLVRVVANGWMFMRRIEGARDGQPCHCLVVSAVRTWSDDGTIPYQAKIEERRSLPDDERDRTAALHVYRGSLLETLDPEMTKGEADPFHGARCRDLLRAAMSVSPLICGCPSR